MPHKIHSNKNDFESNSKYGVFIYATNCFGGLAHHAAYNYNCDRISQSNRIT